MPREWGFDVDSNDVNLDELCQEVSSEVTIAALAFMEQLPIKAPILYKRLKAWALETGKMSWYSWPSNEKPK